ncbi:MAG: hypothetical protein U0S50_10855 [Sphingopyxis sp.]|uniref:hypothetical protein n=1 Tax=Sphingopyxis sp. TaxID=1908224 RepID=UPI002ABD0640|nr:hypothetical protein [Sphingopyxis sp.]MDZ3832305.1 hypothetical protein [Sphingopyxis sp.]
MADILIPNVKFVDIAARETEALQRLKYDIDKLNARKKRNGNILGPLDTAELERLEKLDKARATKGNYFDPLFVATRTAFSSPETGVVPIDFHQEGGLIKIAMPNQTTGATLSKKEEAQKDAAIARVALVMGLLANHGTPVPPIRVRGTNPVATTPDTTHQNFGPFVEGFFRAAGRVAGHMDLAVRVLKLMVEAVKIAGDDEPAVSTTEFASIFEKLVVAGVSASDPNLKRKVDDQMDRVQSADEEKPLHEFTLTLPDLESTTDYEVVEENIRLMGPMIFASMFEELKAFQVVDRLVEMSQRGELPLIKGPAGTKLYQYWREAPNRMSEVERQTFYAMTLGLPTGQPGGSSNGEFQELWLRFVSSVSSLVRENRVDQILRSALPVSINQQQVKKAARDLAANMSLHGYGMAFYAAADLTKQINEMIDLLSDAELRSAFGARDIWGVIDQVAQLELGGARNSSKYRTLASCGAIITNWLADNTDRLRDPTMPIIDIKEVENPPRRFSGQSATSNPTDYDLVNACELWLADSAMADERIEQMAQPRESPQQPSRPIQIPSIARDLLEGTGLGLGMGIDPARRPMSNGHGYAAY